MMMHVKPPHARFDRSLIPADDTALIRLCKKTIEALQEDKLACDAACDARVIFEQQEPPYPTLKWRYAQGNYGVADLRDALKKYGPESSATWKRNMRMQIAAAGVARCRRGGAAIVGAGGG